MVGQSIIQRQCRIVLRRHLSVVSQTVGMYGQILPGNPMLPGADHHITMCRNGEMTTFGIETTIRIIEGAITGLIAIFGDQQVIAGKHAAMIAQVIGQQTGIVIR
ncbi:hypothetical protein BQ6471_00014 [Vibrio gazogenes]|nr:hypothetical protein BQ6471_00014 [Vibrio gazogenes]